MKLQNMGVAEFFKWVNCSDGAYVVML